MSSTKREGTDAGAEAPTDIGADLPPTIAQLPFFAGGRYPKPDLIGRCTGDRVVATSGRDLVEHVRDLSLGLTALGMAKGDRIALLAESRPEWLIADFAVLTAGGVTTPIYPTLAAEQIAFILRDSEASLAIVSTPALLGKLLTAIDTAPSVKTVVVMDAAPASQARVPVVSYADVASRGHRQILDGWGVGRSFHDAAKSVQPSDLATIIYTSGTTGDPKGVRLTHGNLAANIEGVQAVLRLGPEDTALSFLPLCHAFERMVAYVYLACGVSIIFAESFDTIARDLKFVRPTVMTAVPRVFEKLHAQVLVKGREVGGVSRFVFDWAVGVGAARGRRLSEGKSLSWLMRMKSALADRLVFEKIRDGVGGRLRFAVSGSAPLRADIGRFFYGVGLPILEGYGLTETAPVLSVTPLECVRFGVVGRPLPNVELRLAEDGEILVRGPNVMAGYHNRPKDTADALREGWFHTGDIGSIDAEGFLHITDRKKELLVTSGGKKIAPQPIEAELKVHDLIQDAMLVGDGRHFPSALLVPDWGPLCRRLGVSKPADAPAAAALLERDDVRALFQKAVDGLNQRLAQFERIKRFALLSQEFSVATGELSPTLKLKRRVIEKKYGDVIEAMYG